MSAIVVNLRDQGDEQRAKRYLASQAERCHDGRMILSARPYQPPRNQKQNRRLWSCLEDIARQVCWDGVWLSKEDWKDVLSAGAKQHRTVRGVEGGIVVLGARTSEMSRSEMSELLDFVIWFGTEQGVEWTLPPDRQGIERTPRVGQEGGA